MILEGSEYCDHADRHANLQLLDRSINNEKHATLPGENGLWLCARKAGKK